MCAIRLLGYPTTGLLALFLGRPATHQTDTAAVDTEDECSVVMNASAQHEYVGVSAPPEEEQAAEAKQERRTAALQKNSLLVSMFVVNTALQVYVGAKCISFMFPVDSTALPCVLMASSVIALNVEALLIKELVSTA